MLLGDDDKIHFYDGETPLKPRLLTVCNTCPHYKVITSTGKYMLIHLSTNKPVESRFVFRYKQGKVKFCYCEFFNFLVTIIWQIFFFLEFSILLNLEIERLLLRHNTLACHFYKMVKPSGRVVVAHPRSVVFPWFSIFSTMFDHITPTSLPPRTLI